MVFHPNLITLPLAFKGICNHTKDQILTYLLRVSGGCGDPSYLRTSQMKTLENIEYLFIPGGALAVTISDSSSIGAFNAQINSFSAISSYHKVVTKLHFQRHKILVFRSRFFPIMTQLKVYNVILIKLNPQIPMVSIILTMGMFFQQH